MITFTAAQPSETIVVHRHTAEEAVSRVLCCDAWCPLYLCIIEVVTCGMSCHCNNTEGSVMKLRELCERWKTTLGRLDILINNAAQTARHPAQTYSEIVSAEADLLPLEWESVVHIQNEQNFPLIQPIIPSKDDDGLTLNSTTKTTTTTPLSAQLALIPLLEEDQSKMKDRGLTEYCDPKDPRNAGSWQMRIGQIPIAEALETTVINSIAPLELIQRLLPLLRETAKFSEHKCTWIVNVTAMEGSFSKEHKAAAHVHTNMAKAALNMIVRTEAEMLSRSNVLLNAVDTGWIDDMSFVDFFPPLDAVDGAARVLEPIWSTIVGNPFWGQFRKDYTSSSW